MLYNSNILLIIFESCMMNDTFYRKIGRKYIPVSYYNSEVMDAFPVGSHIVTVYRGGLCKRYCVDPALLPMMAAGKFATDGMIKAMSNRREQSERTSQFDIVDAGVQAMAVEAERMLAIPAIKEAYDHFMMLCKLCQDSDVKV